MKFLKTAFMIIYWNNLIQFISIRHDTGYTVYNLWYNLHWNMIPKSTARGRVGRLTDCGVRGLGFKSPGSILTSRTETSSLSRVVRDGWDPCSVPLKWVKKSLLRWGHRLGSWTATTVQETTQKTKTKHE